jgi:hypothetical protein
VLDLLTTAEGKEILVIARGTATRHFEERLSNGELGDSKAWVDITLLGPTGAFPLGDDMKVGNGRPTLGQQSDCRRLCEQMRQRSIRTNGLSCREAEDMGDTRRDDETYHLGNAVINLTPGGTYKLIVSTAGPHDRACEEISIFMAELIAIDVLRLMRDYEPAPAPQDQPEDQPAYA